MPETTRRSSQGVSDLGPAGSDDVPVGPSTISGLDAEDYPRLDQIVIDLAADAVALDDQQVWLRFVLALVDRHRANDELLLDLVELLSERLEAYTARYE